MFDIAIIGAGPAGATLARLIGEKYKVLLVDKRQLLDTPEGFSSGKCCGGLLAPDAQRMLSKLGLGLPKRVLEEPQLFVVRAIDTSCMRFAPLPLDIVKEINANTMFMATAGISTCMMLLLDSLSSSMKLLA